MSDYNAAGWMRKHVMKIIDAEEMAFKGTANYPWSKELKASMADAVDGMDEVTDVHDKIREMGAA